MAGYIGPSPPNRILSSADIADNSITGAKIVAGTIEASDVASDMATQAEIDLKANIASPTFTGTTNVASGVTLPAGHVVKTTAISDTPTSASGGGSGDTAWDICNTYTNSSPTSNTFYDTTNYFKYTPLQSGNILIINYSFALRLGGSGQHGYAWQWKVTPAGGSESTVASLNAHIGGTATSNLVSEYWHTTARGGDSVQKKETTLYYTFGSGVNHTFKFFVGLYNDNYIAQGGIYSSNCSLILQEIQG